MYHLTLEATHESSGHPKLYDAKVWTKSWEGHKTLEHLKEVETSSSSMYVKCYNLADDAHGGQAEEQMRTVLWKNVEPDGMVEEWKKERQEADSLLRSLYEAHREDEKHRKWLLRRWPEWLREGCNDSLPDTERFIPECYVRDGEDDSIRNLLKESLGLLQGEDDEHGQLDVPEMVAMLSDEGVAESIPLLLPKLQCKALQSILSILSGRKREAKNRQWLIEQISKDWTTFVGHSEDTASMKKLQKILSVVRDPNCFRQETPPGQLLLEASCPFSAACSALTQTQLEQLPLTCLHIMLEVLLEKPPEVMVGTLPVGGNKERLVTTLLEKGRALLAYDQAGEALPESLRKSLVVMSVSARYAFGDDGNLIDFLGPLSSETQVLQGNLLSALSYLNKLNFENLQVVHRVLIGAPKLYRMRHPLNLRNPIKRILLDCLLRSEVRAVPEEVKTAAVTIRTLAMRQFGRDGHPVGDGLIGNGQPVSDSRFKVPLGDDARLEMEVEPTFRVSDSRFKVPLGGDARMEMEVESTLHVSDSRFKVPLGDDARMEVEVESTLQISSHLLQIMYNWKEVLAERYFNQERQMTLSGSDVNNLVHDIGTSSTTQTTPRRSSLTIRSSTDVIQLGEERVAAHTTYGDDEDMRTRTGSDSFEKVGQGPNTGWTNTTTSNRPGDCEDDGIDGKSTEGFENVHLTTIADEAAKVGYALVGCAMERTARSSGVSLKRPVRKYLRSGTIKKVRTCSGEGMNVEQHQLVMILKIAEKIPEISPRIMENVKRRLGRG